MFVGVGQPEKNVTVEKISIGLDSEAPIPKVSTIEYKEVRWLYKVG